MGLSQRDSRDGSPAAVGEAVDTETVTGCGESCWEKEKGGTHGWRAGGSKEGFHLLVCFVLSEAERGSSTPGC